MVVKVELGLVELEVEGIVVGAKVEGVWLVTVVVIAWIVLMPFEEPEEALVERRTDEAGARLDTLVPAEDDDEGEKPPEEEGAAGLEDEERAAGLENEVNGEAVELLGVDNSCVVGLT